MNGSSKEGTPSSFDVCVVGAGPAGLAAASTLSEGGARVILLDRHRRPGGKACGGGLTREAWEPAGIVDGSCGPSFFSSLRVYAPTGSVVLETEDPFVKVVDRVAWQGELLDRVREGGARVNLGERFLGFKNGVVRTDRGAWRCGLLIGADGASSRVRRSVGLDTGLCLRAWQVTVPSDRVGGSRVSSAAPSVFFDPGLFGSGYGWCFPADDELRIGCGVTGGTDFSRGLRGRFFQWIESLGVDVGVGLVQSGTIGCGYAGHRFGRVFLAGDAAGLASPITGEGIAQALLSGREVAREILDSSYRSSVIPALARRHRRTYQVLSTDLFSQVLFGLAPMLLRVPRIREAAVERYCG